MAAKDFLKDLKMVRRDLSDLVFHFTKPRLKMAEGFFKGKPEIDKEAPQVLLEILQGKNLNGGLGFIKGMTKCVCFTESPITELANLFHLLKKHDDKRYQPYGLAVKKEWLFSAGGRPVIYQPDVFSSSLDKSVKHFHVTYDPDKAIDFSWEREWRVPTDKLPISPDSTLVVVPTAGEALALSKTLSAEWMIVSLDLFGFSAP